MEYNEIKDFYENKGLEIGVVYKIEPLTVRSNSYSGGNTDLITRVQFDSITDSEGPRVGIALYADSDRELRNPGYFVFGENESESSINDPAYGLFNISDLDAIIQRMNPVIDKCFYEEEIRRLEQRIEIYRNIISR